VFWAFFPIAALVAGWWCIFRPSECSRIPVVWSSSTTPGIEAVVDGKKCLLKLGTSSKFFLSLNENGLECVADKTPRGTGRWHDRRGNFYESPTYAVKNLTIGNMVFSDVVAQSKDAQEDQRDTIWENPHCEEHLWPTISGWIGRPLLEKTNLLLDLGRNMIIATKSEDVLKKQGIFLDTMKKFPLEPEDRGLVVKVDTSMGPLRLEINTGATVNMARASSIKAMSDCAWKLRKDFRELTYFATDLVSDIARWQQYTGQVEGEEKNPIRIKAGPMAGRSAKQLDLAGAAESNPSQDSEITTKEDLKSKKCTTTAEKTEHVFGKKI
jgi:hypothetical protein